MGCGGLAGRAVGCGGPGGRAVGCGGIGGRALDFLLTGHGFKTTSTVSKLRQFSSPHLACIFRRRH